jgi:alpha-ketoglutarate-dependent 2,4-dichlorophenoxyacetate dioxygenase
MSDCFCKTPLPKLAEQIQRMPSSTTLSFTPQHPTFIAEVQGVDWTKPLSPQVIEEIRDGINKYGVLIFRGANINDEQHIEFAKNFGELEVSPAVKLYKNLRLKEHGEIFDLSNLNYKNELVTTEDRSKFVLSKGN